LIWIITGIVAGWLAGVLIKEAASIWIGQVLVAAAGKVFQVIIIRLSGAHEHVQTIGILR